MNDRRYPLAALVTASGLTEAALGRRVGLSGSSLKQARERGLLSDPAERYADRAGFHPLEVWPDFGSEWLTECASDGCDTLFVPRDAKGQQRYCSDRCRLREKTRRYRATPQGAQKAREVRRRYYWSDPKIRAREAEVKARPSARRAEARRRRELRAEAREDAA